MDPVHLLPEELNYELAIRGVFNLTNSRQKTQCIREFLRREETGEQTIVEPRLGQLNPTSEIAICAQILGEIEIAIQDREFNPVSRTDCRSRLVHVISRIKRAKPVSPEEQTAAYEILVTAESRLSLFDRAITATATSRRASIAASFTNSPLADVLEAIQSVVHQKDSPAVQSVGQVARESQGRSSGARRSLLDPTVQSFVPERDENHGNVLQLPSLADLPAPPVAAVARNVQPIFTGNLPEQASEQRPTRTNNGRHSDDFRFQNANSERAAQSSDQTYAPQLGSYGVQATRFGRQSTFGGPGLENTRYESQHMLRNMPGRMDPGFGDAAFTTQQMFREPPGRPQNFVSPVMVRNAEGGYVHFDNEYLARQRRKTVPVHQWKVTYSGDGQGIHLYDFLSELRMLQRSEGVSDEELVSSFVHLLSGRARLWYRTWFDTFRTWEDLSVAMKKEFLPPKYDYKLLTTITNRKQKPNETFAEYLGLMQGMLRHLAIPITEQHRLSIIEENILPRYSLATSVVEITSLEQLSNICRRVDFAHARSPISVPLDRVDEPRQTFRSGQGPNRSRDVHEISTDRRISESYRMDNSVRAAEDTNPFRILAAEDHQQEEILEMRSGEPRNARRTTDNERRECYNCRRFGHNFSECPSSKTGIFCYRCGSRDVKSFSCKQCEKNGKTDSAANAGVPNPQRK